MIEKTNVHCRDGDFDFVTVALGARKKKFRNF